MLTQYITDVQDLVNDQQGQFFKLPTLTKYINRARRRVAGASGCLRLMPPGTMTNPGQEVYPFTDWLPQCQQIMPGVSEIISCRSLAVSMGIGGWKPMWRYLVWTDFQARFRIYHGTFYGTISEPGWWTQYGLGMQGALFLAPIPAQHNPMEVDLTLLPTPLTTDADPEPIPYPWIDAVPYFAGVLCLLQQQRKDDATALMQMFNTELPMCASIAKPAMLQSMYGAVVRAA
jgi:hypothetical protein